MGLFFYGILEIKKQKNMDEKSPQEISEILTQFEKELARLEAERAQIITHYTHFLEQKQIDIVMKKIQQQ